ncbi:MAG: hypothetical protein NWF00_04765 [Candidatus Bathyarchaeota archaeon]|nr:hypothetical protein [Candidatus Bathyarchaeota archaeon]
MAEKVKMSLNQKIALAAISVLIVSNLAVNVYLYIQQSGLAKDEKLRM